jgi:hypothetical protein
MSLQAGALLSMCAHVVQVGKSSALKRVSLFTHGKVIIDQTNELDVHAVSSMVRCMLWCRPDRVEW